LYVPFPELWIALHRPEKPSPENVGCPFDGPLPTCRAGRDGYTFEQIQGVRARGKFISDWGLTNL
jgi:hypothetical protein